MYLFLNPTITLTIIHLGHVLDSSNSTEIIETSEPEPETFPEPETEGSATDELDITTISETLTVDKSDEGTDLSVMRLKNSFLTIKKLKRFQLNKSNGFLSFSGDCTWGDWEIFSCSKSCGGGERNKMRTQIPKEQCGEKEFVTEECNTEECPEDSDAV